MPTKKKTTKTTAKKVQVKQLKKVAKKTSRAKVVAKKIEKKPAVAKVTRAPKKVRPVVISQADQIVHAAETYAVSIDEIIRSGNREYKLMQMNGRGQEITAPKIEARIETKIETRSVEAAQPVQQAQQEAENIHNETVEPEDALSEEDKKALAIVRARLESSTVMIRSISPLQSHYAHSSRKFVDEAPKKKGTKAPLVFVSSAAIVFAAFVIAVVVSKTGNFGPAQLVAPQVQKVAGAETGPQQYETAKFTFSYPGNWYVTSRENTLTLKDSQAKNAESIALTSSALNGKSFQDWLKDQKNVTASDVKAVGTATPQVYKVSESAYFVVGESDVVSLQTQSTKKTTQNVLQGVAQSLAFAK